MKTFDETRDYLLSFNMQKAPPQARWDQIRPNDYPSLYQIKCAYGSWGNFIKACGLKPANAKIRKSSYIKSLSHYRKRIRSLASNRIAPPADMWDAARQANEYNADSLARLTGKSWTSLVESFGLKPAPRGIPEDYVFG